nr:G protein-coupled receptor [Proales similis]
MSKLPCPSPNEEYLPKYFLVLNLGSIIYQFQSKMLVFFLLFSSAFIANGEVCSFAQRLIAPVPRIYITCQVERNFSEILTPQSTRSDHNLLNVLSEVVIFPNRPLILDGSFQLQKYFKLVNESELASNDLGYSRSLIFDVRLVRFANIIGIDIEKSCCEIYSTTRQQNNLRIEFTFSQFKPFYNGRPLVNGCELEVDMIQSMNEIKPLRAGQVVFDTSTRYYRNTCSIIFNHAKINFLEFGGISSSLLGNNSLGFDYVLRDGQTYPLKVSIDTLTLHLYINSLDSRLLNHELFKTTRRIFINGKTERLEPCLIEKYKHVVLEVVNLRALLGSGISWCDNPNQTDSKHFITISIKQSKLYFKFLSNYLNVFAFSDEDLCLFRKYPIDDRHFFLFATTPIPNCTCSIFWLVHNHRLNLSVEIINEVYPQTNMFSICTENKTYDEWMEECDFDNRFAKCDLNQSTRAGTEWTAFETTFLMAGLKYAFAVVLLPIVCGIGVVTSCLSIAVLRKMIAKLAEKRYDDTSKRSRLMYSYMLQHAVGSAAVCALFAFKPLTECVSYGGIFCSPFYTSWHARLFDAIGLNMLGTALKLHTTLTALLFSLARLVINVKNKSRFLVRIFSKMRPTYVSYGCFLFALTLSSVKLFTSSDYSALSLDSDTLRALRIPVFSAFITYYSSLYRLGSIYYLNLSLEIILDLLLPLLIVIIDLALLFLMRKQNANRSKISQHLQTKSEENEKQFTKMIVFNGISNFLFRMPLLSSNIVEFIAYHYFAFFYFNFPYCQFEDYPLMSLCPSVLSISHVLLQIGYIVDFALLIKFNKDFRHLCLNGPL